MNLLGNNRKRRSKIRRVMLVIKPSMKPITVRKVRKIRMQVK